MYVGVGGVARKVRSAFVGDDEGRARLFYGVPYPLGIITPDNMTSDTTPSPFRASAKSIWSASYDAWSAFTSNDNCIVASGAGEFRLSDVPADGEWWVQVDLGEARCANRGRFKNYSYETSTYRIFPGEFQILGSNDDAAWDDAITSDKWIVVGSVTGYTQPSSTNTWAEEFTLDNPGYYRYYRIRVTRGAMVATYTDGHCVIKQIELSAV
jgi:hypothetical protein